MITEEPGRIPRSLYAAMLLQFGVGGAILPFIAMWLRDRGLEMSQVSLIFLGGSSTLLIFPFLWGMLSDRFIPLNRLFTIINGVAMVALGMLTRQQGFAGLLVWFMVFYACYHPTLTLMNALSFHHLADAREQFGVLRAWGSLGWILPSFPIFLWLANSPSRNLSFGLYLGMGLCLAMVINTFFLPHTEPGARAAAITPDPSSLAYWPAVRKLLANGDYLVILVSFFLIAAAFSIFVYYSPPYLEDCGVDRAWIGPIQCLGVALEVAAFPYLRRFIRRWGFTASMMTGASALFVRHFLYASTTNLGLLAGSYLLAGMVIVFFHIPASILVNQLAPVEVRATAQTLFVFFGSGMGPMFANWVAGWITAQSENRLPPVFLFAGILAVLAAVLVFSRRHHIARATAPENPG